MNSDRGETSLLEKVRASVPLVFISMWPGIHCMLDMHVLKFTFAEAF